MDWNTLAYFAFVAAFVILMMRGCGGGMCGMGHRGRNNSRTDDEQCRDDHAGKAASKREPVGAEPGQLSPWLHAHEFTTRVFTVGKIKTG